MAFRGCAGLTADQIAAIYAELGGTVNADTQQTITQYFVTVPAQDLEVALRVDAACMQDVQDSQEQWAQERGAIEQEVSRDLSNPTYKFITRLNEDLFAGTPYAHDALGTRPSFDATTGEMLKKFYKDWYAPNNAILVITGDVDPTATLAKVKQFYGAIPRRAVPRACRGKAEAREAGEFHARQQSAVRTDFRFGTHARHGRPRFRRRAHSGGRRIQPARRPLRIVPAGKALGTEFGMAETYPKASVAFGAAAVPAGADPAPSPPRSNAFWRDTRKKACLPNWWMRRARAKSRARNSSKIPSAIWHQSGRSPWPQKGGSRLTELVDAMKKVTVEDVNRVAKTYLTSDAIMATFETVALGRGCFGQRLWRGGDHDVAPTKPVTLPDWAEASVKSLKIPQAMRNPRM